MLRALLLTVAMASPAMADPARVVGLGGSATEIAFAVGAGDLLIGRDSSSTFPPEAQGLADVGYMRQLSPEGVLSAAPDLILAEEGAGPPQAVEVLKSAKVDYVELPEPRDAAGIVARIEAAGAALGREAEAEQVAAQTRADLDAVAQVVARDARPRPRVLFVLSMQGGRVMAAGKDTSADVMIGLAGGQNAAAGLSGWKPMTDEAILSAAPDVVVMMRRGDSEADKAAGFDEPDRMREQVLGHPAIAATPAGRNGAFVVMPGLYLLGLGPRAGKAAMELHAAIHGDAAAAPADGDAAPAAPRPAP